MRWAWAVSAPNRGEQQPAGPASGWSNRAASAANRAGGPSVTSLTRMKHTWRTGQHPQEAIAMVELSDEERAIVEVVADLWTARSGPPRTSKTDPEATPRHRGISILLVEKGPGLTVSRDLPKLGYKGVESCELSFDGHEAPLDAVLGGEEGHGFAQMMRGLEVGRIQVAARALGVGRAALEDSLRYTQEREAFGRPIWQHQSIGNYLADMATQLRAARLLTLDAAERLDAGERCDMEAGMAKLYASEAAMQIALNAVRIHGAAGYSTEFDVERYFRDAPLMIVGEGTNEIQRNVIVKQLISRYPR
jgi:alkylation response protein AidB-like acyl-CoA dehydrogenase